MSEEKQGTGFLMFEGNREQQILFVKCPVIDAWECTIGIMLLK